MDCGWTPPVALVIFVALSGMSVCIVKYKAGVDVTYIYRQAKGHTDLMLWVGLIWLWSWESTCVSTDVNTLKVARLSWSPVSCLPEHRDTDYCCDIFVDDVLLILECEFTVRVFSDEKIPLSLWKPALKYPRPILWHGASLYLRWITSRWMAVFTNFAERKFADLAYSVPCFNPLKSTDGRWPADLQYRLSSPNK